MIVHERHDPTLMLIYLPHLDYDLQRFGPDDPQSRTAMTEIDGVVGSLLKFFRKRGVRVMLVSEYGIEAVHDAVHVNRLLREDGAIAVRQEQGLELLDAGASDAFAVADHQVAHVYVRDQKEIERFARFLSGAHGVELALTRKDQAAHGIDHERSGDIVLVAEAGRWFSHDYWLDDRRAPDYARTVDIHRKPGYDPRELFIDPNLKAPKLQIAARVLKKKLGFRMLMDVIPLDARLVRGSHGRVDMTSRHQPLLMTEKELADDRSELPCESVKDVILEQLFGD